MKLKLVNDAGEEIASIPWDEARAQLATHLHDNIEPLPRHPWLWDKVAEDVLRTIFP